MAQDRTPSLPPSYPGGAYPSPAPSSGGTVNGWLVAILLILVAGLYLQMSGLWPGRLFDPNAKPRAITPRGDLASDEKATIDLFHSVNQSVVHITTSATGWADFRMNPVEVQRGSGSGFIWDSKGYIVTNYHVVRDAALVARGGGGNVQVALPNNPNPYIAEIVGINRDADLAVLKINAPASDLKPILVGTSSDLQIGQKVFAIGSPFSLDHSLTTGIVSGLGREIETDAHVPIKDVIQVNAAVNPGNSGGPLLDSAGRLIGVTTAIASHTGEFSGVGFAIPVDLVNTVVPELIRSGTPGGAAQPPALGVTLFSNEVTSRLRENGFLHDEGVLVRSVLPGGAAEAAGVQPTRQVGSQLVLGDLIVAIDGKPITTAKAIFDAVAAKKVGDVIKLTVVRGGKRLELPITLRPRPVTPPED